MHINNIRAKIISKSALKVENKKSIRVRGLTLPKGAIKIRGR